MFILRKVFSVVLSFIFFVGPSVSAKEFSLESYVGPTVVDFSKTRRFVDVLGDIQKHSPEIGAKLEIFLRSKELLNEKLPVFSVGPASIAMGLQNEIKISRSRGNTLLVTWNGKKRVIPPELPFDEQLRVIDALNPKLSSSFFSLLVPEAYAGAGDAVMFLGGLALLVGVFSARLVIGAGGQVASLFRRELSPAEIAEANARATRFHAICENSTGLSSEDLANAYNDTSAFKRSMCSPVEDGFIQLCHRLELTLTCIHRKIGQSRTTIDADRALGKDVEDTPSRPRDAGPVQTTPQ